MDKKTKTECGGFRLLHNTQVHAGAWKVLSLEACDETRQDKAG